MMTPVEIISAVLFVVLLIWCLYLKIRVRKLRRELEERNKDIAALLDELESLRKV